MRPRLKEKLERWPLSSAGQLVGPLVYFVEMGKDGPIKIGFCGGAFIGRARALQTFSPYDLYLLGHLPGGPDLEAELHREFSRDRLRGEWFKPSASVRRLVLTIQEARRIGPAVKPNAER